MAALLATSASAWAATYFVTSSGTDAGDCTVTPCQ
jgi:hypothetical protein